MSEDESEVDFYHHHHHQLEIKSPNMSKSDLRKTHKPIMEKRRRARINHSLNEIKTLILEAMNKDPARHSKLEKADILEMAVKHLQQIQRQHLAIAMATDPAVIRKFRSGFADCTAEIDRYINRIDGVNSGIKDRLLNHLEKCTTNMKSVHLPATSPQKVPTFPLIVTTETPATNRRPSSTVEDLNNNATMSLRTNQIPGSIEVIPSRLSSGEIALILPKTNNNSLFSSISRGKLSAFATVVKSSPPVTVPVKIETETCSTNYSDQSEISREDDERVPREAALSVITNQSERYRQAQMVPDSTDFIENRVFKRTYDEMTFPLFYSGANSAFKKRKVDSGDDVRYPTSSFSNQPTVTLRMGNNPEECSSSTSAQEPRDNNNEPQNDMWRPW